MFALFMMLKDNFKNEINTLKTYVEKQYPLRIVTVLNK